MNLATENANLLQANRDGVDWYTQSREDAARYRTALEDLRVMIHDGKTDLLPTINAALAPQA